MLDPPRDLGVVPTSPQGGTTNSYASVQLDKSGNRPSHQGGNTKLSNGAQARPKGWAGPASQLGYMRPVLVLDDSKGTRPGASSCQTGGSSGKAPAARCQSANQWPEAAICRPFCANAQP
ncbi:unnamed protein product [Bursaphelenchus xylophilus]|uniref:(pine wood nematode) hypothetical protein n=1 Tax=Bursaphelenchus xylophilus TaxID=6326 RepID=A0A1I7S0C3_BURXY|nr:unnamed protein product [Bursaphelenchus xylophilus]CAG9132195.1 unnamed protein product [Bursaphelenchus xylophilus]